MAKALGQRRLGTVLEAVILEMLDDAERRTSAGKKTHHGLLSGI